MIRRKVRLCLGAIVAVVLTSGLNLVPAAASAPAPPAPAQAPNRPNLGILSERQSFAGPRSAGTAPARPASPKTSVCGAAWRIVDSPNGTWNNIIAGIGGASPTDMWFVGNSQSATTGDYLDLAEHWDGSAWNIVPTPDPGASNFLNDVAVIATNDVWAVGTSEPSGFARGLVLHWNGTAWTQVATPDLPTRSLFNDVVAIATNDVWAVGQQLDSSGVVKTLIEHWTGASWSVVTSVSVGGGDNSLLSVAATAANDVWAVGYSNATTTPGHRLTLVEHWDGASWSATNGFSADYMTLLGVAAKSSTDVVAVGYAIVQPGAGTNGGYPNPAAFHWNGTTWSAVDALLPGIAAGVLTGVVASPSEYWAVGFFAPTSNPGGAFQPVAMNGDGSNAWAASGQNAGPGLPASGTGDNDLFSVAAPASGDIWTVGVNFVPQGITRILLENYSGLAAPASTTAVAGDASADVTWSAPCDGGSAITSYVVSAYDGCALQGSVTVSGSPPAVTTTYAGLSNGNSFTFKVAAVNGFGLGPQSTPSTAVKPIGASPPTFVTACSTRQYTLTGSNGATWMNLDSSNLSVSFTPTADSYAVISGNADLWTANRGFNQDIGIAVLGGVYPKAAGQPEAWKESGGYAGTFSPNAAYVHAAIPVLSGITYSAKLTWKANKPDAGTIVAGAGPAGTAFSPTRLTVQLIPTASGKVFSKTSTAQYHLTGSNGTSWRDMDATGLSIQFTPPAGGWYAIVSGNADLWTSSAGYNQDIAVSVTGASGATLQPPCGSPDSWKESGGYGGTYSPNAAYVTASRFVFGGNLLTAKVQWKANKPDPGSIYAGAGPINGKFSTTTLTVILIPTATPGSVCQSAQFSQVNSDGYYWQTLQLNNATPPLSVVVEPAVSGAYSISLNADLWTAVAGFNQDIGIMVSGGVYGSGTVVAWKESGGGAGTYSPNAAFLETVLNLQGGSSYLVKVVWKANRFADVYDVIVAGAGPINGEFSPTWLMAIQLS